MTSAIKTPQLVLQDWTCSTARFCLTYDGCHSISYCQTEMFQPGELKSLVLSSTSSSSAIAAPTSRSSLSAQREPRCHAFAHLLGCCYMDAKGTRLDLLLQARGRKAGAKRSGGGDIKSKPSCVTHKDWNLVILFVFPARKAVSHLWGKA